MIIVGVKVHMVTAKCNKLTKGEVTGIINAVHGHSAQLHHVGAWASGGLKLNTLGRGTSVIFGLSQFTFPSVFKVPIYWPTQIGRMNSWISWIGCSLSRQGLSQGQ